MGIITSAGDMALAYALHHIESNNLAKLTNYGEYLERHPPTQEAEIWERSAWSCAHGVERWNSNCGCNSGGHPNWNQEWRAPLRQALDWLRDTIAPPIRSKRAARSFTIPGKRATTISTSFSIALRKTSSDSSKEQGNHELNEAERIARAEAHGNAAARHADVHELRLVLRRTFRNRNDAGHSIRRADASAISKKFSANRSKQHVPRSTGIGQKQYPGT